MVSIGWQKCHTKKSHGCASLMFGKKMCRCLMTETDISKVLIEGEYATIMGVKYKRVEEPKKSETLYDIIADWWDEIFLNDNEAAETIESLVDRIEREWLPKPQSAAGSQNVYVECTVEGFNDCLTKIKGKLR